LKLPRDVSGEELVRSLRRLGYEITRQTGSHIRLTSRFKQTEHQRNDPGPQTTEDWHTRRILGDVASYLNLAREELIQKLFG